MHSEYPPLTWEEAIEALAAHHKANLADKTGMFYATQLGQLKKWAETEGIGFHEFGKRHLDRYIGFRRDAGRSRTTLRHDGVAAKKLFDWSAKEKLIDRSPLAQYKVHNAPRPFMYMPTDEDISRLLEAIPAYWDLKRHPAIKNVPPRVRTFHRERNGAIIHGLLDTACRIGEILALKMDDVRLAEGTVVFRETKGKEPRTIPISSEWREVLEEWLNLRTRVMQAVPKEEDPGWIFVSEGGSRVDKRAFLHALRRITEWARLPDKITLHSLRRYSLNKYAAHNLLAAQDRAGHKDTKTTLIYVKLTPDQQRRQTAEVGVLRAVISRKAAMSDGKPARRRLSTL